MNQKVGLLLKKTVLSAMFLALCMVLPFLTGQIPEIGSALSPMHIPVLLCGFVCGPIFGAVVGFIAPLLRFLLFSMPPIYPTGVAMAFELASYGVLTGILYKIFPKKIQFVYVNTVLAMLGGRIVWGIVRALISLVGNQTFTFSAFMAGGFINAVPALILHIILVPALIIALQRAKLIPLER